LTILQEETPVGPALAGMPDFLYRIGVPLRITRDADKLTDIVDSTNAKQNNSSSQSCSASLLDQERRAEAAEQETNIEQPPFKGSWTSYSAGIPV
jgi:hypothetical protein